MGILIKDWRQIEGIRKSCKLAGQTLKHIEQYVTPGISTNELNKLADIFMRANGAIPAPLNYLGFPKETCISVNEVICHGIPSDYKLKEGDIVNVDVTTILDGYYGDTSMTYAVGAISEDAKHLMDVAKKCLEIGIKQIKPGNYFGNIGYEITKYANLQQCTVVEQFCGHGCGIFFHEEPQVQHYMTKKDQGEKMKVGHIFTVEPMINQKGPDGIIDEHDGWTVRTADGGLSAQYEETVLVTMKGYEVLTTCN